MTASVYAMELWGLHQPRDSLRGDIKECRNSISRICPVVQ